MTITEWSTSAVGPTERFAYWREAVCDAFLDLRPERGGTEPFRGRIQVTQGPLVEVASIAASAQHVYRRASHDGGWCYLNLQVNGVGLTGQGGETVVTRPGDAVVVRTDRPFEFRFDDDFVQVSVRLPSELNALVDRPVQLDRRSDAGRALRSMLRLYPLGPPATDSDRGSSEAMSDWLDTALVDLVTTSLRQRRTRPERATAADPWPLIDADITRHLTDPRLTPAETAARVGLSVRSLHHAFEGRPLTFAREVRQRRLALARAMLIEPGLDHLRIRDIAADCGFSDVHHFQRVYRAATGEPPGATRRNRPTR